jgi:hypothetical protein
MTSRQLDGKQAGLKHRWGPEPQELSEKADAMSQPHWTTRPFATFPAAMYVLSHTKKQTQGRRAVPTSRRVAARTLLIVPDGCVNASKPVGPQVLA